MKKINIDKLSKSVKKLSRTVSKYSPEILAVVGTVSIGAGFVIGCKKAVIADKAVDTAKADIEDAKADIEDNEACAKEIKSIKKACTLKVIKEYSIPVSLVIGGTTCLLGSVGILKKRTATLSTAYTALNTAFNEYRSRVVAKLGEKADREFRYGVKEETVEMEKVTEDGKSKTVKEKVKVATSNPDGIYTFRFDSSSCFWDKRNMDQNLYAVKSLRSWANDVVTDKGLITVSEMLDRLDLGKQKTSYSQVMGWIDDDSKEGFARDWQVNIGFGPEPEDVKNCIYWDEVKQEKYILLEMKVDGSVFEWYDVPKRYRKFRRMSKPSWEQLKDCKVAAGLEA